MNETLNDVQKSVSLQIARDYKDRNENEMVYLMVAGLTEEAGEVSGLVKRTLRNFEKDKSAQNIDRWVEELGDVLWYVTAVASIMDIPLEYIWEQNCKKLEARYGGLN